MRVARVITGVAMVVGMLLVIGAVGTSDYMVEAGEYLPVSETLATMGKGVLMMVPYWIVCKVDESFDIEVRVRVYRR